MEHERNKKKIETIVNCVSVSANANTHTVFAGISTMLIYFVNECASKGSQLKWKKNGKLTVFQFKLNCL